jgi:hypothetical protein
MLGNKSLRLPGSSTIGVDSAASPGAQQPTGGEPLAVLRHNSILKFESKTHLPRAMPKSASAASVWGEPKKRERPQLEKSKSAKELSRKKTGKGGALSPVASVRRLGRALTFTRMGLPSSEHNKAKEKKQRLHTFAKAAAERVSTIERQQRGLIMPGSEFANRWDMILILCLTFTAIVTPFEVRWG